MPTAKRAPAPDKKISDELLALLNSGREAILPLDQLEQDKKNARTHDERNREAVRLSLKEHGQVEPLVAQLNTARKGRHKLHRILGGNCRHGEMLALGWSHARVLLLDVDDLTADRIALRLNRTAELAEWSFESVAAILREQHAAGIDLTALGWPDYEARPLLESSWQPPALNADFGGTEAPLKANSISLTHAERKTIDRAIAALRKREKDPGISEGRALQKICEAFLKRR